MLWLNYLCRELSANRLGLEAHLFLPSAGAIVQLFATTRTVFLTETLVDQACA